mmetsp:Transcript_40567/g.46724  ORF Transcript_40567/g.46724 Transcript_40567/m.46724 type:complete len:201 (+) Transcript_40567:111-713(+)
MQCSRVRTTTAVRMIPVGWSSPKKRAKKQRKNKKESTNFLVPRTTRFGPRAVTFVKKMCRAVRKGRGGTNTERGRRKNKQRDCVRYPLGKVVRRVAVKNRRTMTMMMMTTMIIRMLRSRHCLWVTVTLNIGRRPTLSIPHPKMSVWADGRPKRCQKRLTSFWPMIHRRPGSYWCAEKTTLAKAKASARPSSLLRRLSKRC